MSKRAGPYLGRLPVMVLLVLAFGLGVGGAIVALGPSGDGPPAPPGGPSPAPSSTMPPPPTQQQQEQFTRDLNTDENLVLAEVARSAPVADGAPGAAPPGTKVDVQWDTFQQVEPGTAAVQATSAGPPVTTYTLLLLHEDGDWRLLAAEATP